MTEQDRYKGKLNDEYKLIMRAWPHERDLRLETAKIIAESIQSFSSPINIIELGSGSGETTAFILEELKKEKRLSGVKFVSIDLDESLINNQKEMLREYTDTGVLEVLAEDGINSLKQTPTESVDIFTASWFLHNFKKPQREEMLREIYRTLKQTGMFVVMDKYVPDDPALEKKLFDEQIQRFDLFQDAGQPDLYKEMVSHENEDRSPDLIMKLVETTDVMTKIGFKNPTLVKRYLRDGILVAKK